MLQYSKDFQDTLHRLLDVKFKSTSKNDKILQDILNKNEKNTINDFQKMLQKSINNLDYDEKKKTLHFNNIEEKDLSKDDVSDVNSKVKLESDLNKVVIENDIDEEETTKVTTNKVNNQLNKRDEILKHIYMATMDEYYSLRERIYKEQIRDGDIALNDKNYLKLLRYENYMKKCDVLFKNSNGVYISNQDKEVSEKENKYVYQSAKSEKNLVNQHQKAVNEVDDLNSQIEDKAEQIMQLNQSDGNVKNYDRKLELLEKEYVALNIKMRYLNPSISKLYMQEEKKEDQEKVTTRVIGTIYEKNKDKKVLDKDVVIKNKKVEGKEEILEDATEIEKNELDSTNLKLASSYVDSAEKALEEKNISRAVYMVNNAKKLVSYEKNSEISDSLKFSSSLKENVILEDKIEQVSDQVEDKVEDKIKNDLGSSTKQVSQTDKIDNYIACVAAEEAIVSSIKLSPVQKECIKYVNTPDERSDNIIANEEKEVETKIVEKSQDKEK